MKKSTGRQYKKKGDPSVTEIIGLLDPGLHQWYGWLGTEECERITKQSTDFGHAVHTLIELYLKQSLSAVSENADVTNCFEIFQRYIDKLELNPILVDPPEGLHSEKYGFNGTPDFINEENKKLVGYDWKTSKKKDRKDHIRQQLFKFGLQCAGYSLLVEENLKRKVSVFKVVQAPRAGGLWEYVFDNLKPYKRHFLNLRELHYEYKGT